MPKKKKVDKLVQKRNKLWKKLVREPVIVRGSLIQTLRPPVEKKGKKLLKGILCSFYPGA